MTARVRTLPQALAEAAQSGEGYVFVDERAETRRSYAEMHAAAIATAAALLEAGARPGDLVALIVGDSELFLRALFGASIAGLVPASLHPPGPTGDVDHYLAAVARTLRVARARAVVTSASLAGSIEGLRAQCPALELVIAIDDAGLNDKAGLQACTTTDNTAVVQTFPPTLAANAGELRRDLAEARSAKAGRSADVTADDLAFVQFTSGSTSEPKGVAITHRSLSANIDAINGPAGIASSETDSAVSWLPLHHDMGLVGMALGAMYCSRPAVLLSPQTFVKRPAEWLRAISRFRGTVSFAPTFAYELCVRRVRPRDLEGLDLSCWRVAGCGGEPIHAPTLAAFAEKLRGVGFRPTSFLPSYGLAEHVLAATFAPRERSLRVESVVSCGAPLPGHEIRIVDESGAELPERAIGEITLSGPSVMKGYYNDATRTAETVRGERLHTGDLGYLADGELFVCGRLKDLLIVNGRNYYPQDVEWAVDDVAGVRRGRVAAFADSHAGLSDRIVIVLEATGATLPDALADAVRRRVSDVCGLYVDDVIVAPHGTIGRTTSGKVQRSAMKARYQKGEFAN